MDPTRLAAVITHADGSTSRWAEDEPDAENVFDGLQIQTALPGGFKSATCVLPRLSQKDTDLELFDDVLIHGAGGGLTAFHGYQSSFPWQTGEETTVNVEAVGWSGALLWNTAFGSVYIDRDLNNWRPLGQATKAAMANTYEAYDFTVEADAQQNLPTLKYAVTGPWAADSLPIFFAVYEFPPGQKPGRLDFDIDFPTDHLGGFELRSSSDDFWTSYVYQDQSSGSGQATWLPSTSGAYREFALMAWHGSSYAGSSEHMGWVYGLTAHGNHGLTYKGAWGTGGYLASDVVRHIVTTGTILPIDEIEPTIYAIPHLPIRSTTPDAAIQQTNAFELYDYGCYERGFFYRSPTNYRRRWHVRTDPPPGSDEGPARISLEGMDAEETANGVVVTYSGLDGVERSVGPPGAATELTSVKLAETSAANPLNRHGYTKLAELQVAFTVLDEQAIRLGEVLLDRLTVPANRGNLTLSGMVADESGSLYPAWYVWAGDSVTVDDFDGVERRIVETSYSHDSRSVDLAVDSLPSRLDAMLEAMQANLIITGSV